MLLRVCDTLGAEWLLNADHIVAIRRGNSEEVLLTNRRRSAGLGSTPKRHAHDQTGDRT